MDYAGQVYVYSPGLSQEDLEKMGATKIENVQETVNGLLSSHENVVVVPDGPYVVGMIK
jgi:ribosomal protein L30/L7E